MIAYLPNPTPAFEYGTHEDPQALGRSVTLFGGTWGSVVPDPRQPSTVYIFTVAKSGARYAVTMPSVRVGQQIGSN